MKRNLYVFTIKSPCILFLVLVLLPESAFSQCSPAIVRGTATINTPNYSLNSAFNANSTAPVLITGLGNNLFTFAGRVSGTAAWQGGVQIQYDPLVGDYLFVQPRYTDNAATSNIATYTIKFNSPVTNLELRTGGMNNRDQTVFTAFLGNNAIQITAANFSNVVDHDASGTIVFTGNSAVGYNTGGGVGVVTNRFTTIIPGPLDSLVIRSGKYDDADGAVTLGFTSLSYTRCVNVPPDVNATFVDTLITGNVSTNDAAPAGTTYGAATVIAGNPGPAVPVISSNGTYTFTSAVPGKFSFLVPMCPPSVLASDCPKVLLTITVLDVNGTANVPVANTDLARTPVNTAVELNTLANDNSGNNAVLLNPASVTVTIAPLHGTTSVNPANGKITYTPTSNFVGIDTLTYQVCDLSNPTPRCVTALQIITIDSSGTANSTTASDDYNRTFLNTPVNGNVLPNDIDPQSNTQTVAVQNTTVPGKGTLLLNSDGSYNFTPYNGYSGPVNFPYDVCDNGTPQACARATLYLLIYPTGTLPIRLSSFTGKANKCSVILQWTTAQELNANKFILESSSDGFIYIAIAETKAANSAGGKSYQHVVAQNATLVYYRLKMVDFDGSFVYSGVVTVKSNCTGSDRINIYPNPAHSTTSVYLQTAYRGKASIIITNTMGQVTETLSAQINTAVNVIPVDVTRLPTGLYFLQMVNDKGERLGDVQRLIKE